MFLLQGSSLLRMHSVRKWRALSPCSRCGLARYLQQKMQHEIFLALAGCPGNVFSVSRETGFYEVSCGKQWASVELHVTALVYGMVIVHSNLRVGRQCWELQPSSYHRQTVGVNKVLGRWSILQHNNIIDIIISVIISVASVWPLPSMCEHPGTQRVGVAGMKHSYKRP